jgi:hypothetical protein
MSSPSTFAPFPVSPRPVFGRAPTPPRPLLHLPPAFYAHPRTRLATPTPALSLGIPHPRPASTANERQWWDTCPRHPAVEATLGLAAPAIPSHSHSLPTSSTRATSVASSDVHSRVRVDVCPVPTVPAAPPHKAAVRPQASFSSFRSTEAWQTRFRRVMAVPAFGPLTWVLEPVVSRGQWEIVVRSACAAALGAWIFIGCLVALPEAK